MKLKHKQMVHNPQSFLLTLLPFKKLAVKMAQQELFSFE